MEKVEQNIYDLLANKELEFTILVDKPNLFHKVFKKTKRNYKIKPFNLDTYIKIANILDKCEEIIKPTKNNELLINSIKGIAKYHSEILDVLSLFLNEKKNFLKKNLSFLDAQKLIIKVLEYNDFAQFFFILNLMKEKITVATEMEKAK